MKDTELKEKLRDLYMDVYGSKTFYDIARSIEESFPDIAKECRSEIMRKKIKEIINNTSISDDERDDLYKWIDRAVTEDDISFALATQVLANYDYRFISEEELAKLKSVKSDWKPSTSQMRALKDVIISSNMSAYSSTSRLLQSLYNDLEMIWRN